MDALGGMARVAGGLVIGAGLLELPHLLGDSIGAAQESAKNVAQLNAVLESTHGVAGVTADDAQNLATQWMKLANVDDDVVLSGENLLLTFTNIGSDVFPMATEAMMNMSAALGQDTTQSAIQLGKALNDPINGATALRRVGVSLTDQQMEQIKAFQESGDLMSAQKIILDELQTEFGGAAEAIGRSKGPLETMKVQFGELQERIGGAVIPVLAELGTSALDAFSAFDEAGGVDAVLGALTGTFQFFGNAAQQAFKLAGSAVQTDLVQNVLGGLDILQGALSGLVAGDFPVFIQTLEDGFDIDLSGFVAFVQQIQDGWATVQQVFAGDWSPDASIDPIVNGLGIAATVVRDQFIPAIQEAGTILSEAFAAAGPEVLQKLSDALGEVVGAFQDIAAAVSPSNQAMSDNAQTVGILAGAFGLLADGVRLSAVNFRGQVQIIIAGIQLVVSTGETIVTWFQSLPSVVESAGASAGAAWDGMVAMFTASGEMLVTGAQAAWDSVVLTITTATTSAVAVVTQWLIDVQTGIQSVWLAIPEDIRADTLLILQVLTETFALGLAALVQWGVDTMTQFTTWGVDTSTAVTTTTTGWLTSFTTQFAAILTGLTTWITDFLAPWITFGNDVLTAATAIGTNILTGITGKLVEVTTAVSTWWSGLISQIQGFASQASTIASQLGAAIMAGIVSGINTGTALISTAFWDSVRGMLDNAKKMLGIASPSAWTAAEIGSPMAEGIIQGLVDSFGQGDERIGDAIRAVVEAALRNNIDPIVEASLALAESTFRPWALGDSGHSAGLHQLHDQGQGFGMGESRFDPRVNAETFAAAHAAQFAQLSQQFSGSQLAAIFGHAAEQNADASGAAYAAAFNQITAALNTMNPALSTAAAAHEELTAASTETAGAETTLKAAGDLKTAMVQTQAGQLATTAGAAGVLAQANEIAAAAEEAHTAAAGELTGATLTAAGASVTHTSAITDQQAAFIIATDGSGTLRDSLFALDETDLAAAVTAAQHTEVLSEAEKQFILNNDATGTLKDTLFELDKTDLLAAAGLTDTLTPATVDQTAALTDGLTPAVDDTITQQGDLLGAIQDTGTEMDTTRGATKKLTEGLTVLDETDVTIEIDSGAVDDAADAFDSLRKAAKEAAKAVLDAAKAVDSGGGGGSHGKNKGNELFGFDAGGWAGAGTLATVGESGVERVVFGDAGYVLNHADAMDIARKSSTRWGVIATGGGGGGQTVVINWNQHAPIYGVNDLKAAVAEHLVPAIVENTRRGRISGVEAG